MKHAEVPAALDLVVEEVGKVGTASDLARGTWGQP